MLESFDSVSEFVSNSLITHTYTSLKTPQAQIKMDLKFVFIA